MRLIILFAFCAFSSISHSQDWTVIAGSNYNSILSGGTPEQLNHKFFKINPYDNSIWTIAPGKIIRIDQTTGDFDKFDYTNCALFDNQMSFLDLAFTSQKVYTVSKFDGIYSFDGGNWILESGFGQGVNLSFDLDTVWLARINEDFVVVEDASVSLGPVSYLRRIVSKNGDLWGNSSVESGLLVHRINGIFELKGADTIPFLMDGKNYDFKFSPHTDSLYTSGDYGISIAYNGLFFDSIGQGNTTGMPSRRIIEFEFDENDNIWAVFGDASLKPTAIGHYNQITKTWSQIYDENNSPLDFSFYNSIEIDPTGNLWVINKYNLFLYGINTTPIWVGVENLNPNLVQLSPNPVSNQLNIKSKEIISSISIFDNSGREMVSSNLNSIEANIDISDLNCGIYTVIIESETGRYSEKIVKH